MIVRVKVGDHFYAVEIADLSANPVIATVEGVRYEVYPESLGTAPGQTAAPGSPAADEASRGLPAEDLSLTAILAPMPGVIAAVSVKPGQQVARGTELCILEAMKMKNIIRAPRSGIISKVEVSLGQQVRYRDILVEFQE